jgi:hypothetical protein
MIRTSQQQQQQQQVSLPDDGIINSKAQLDQVLLANLDEFSAVRPTMAYFRNETLLFSLGSILYFQPYSSLRRAEEVSFDLDCQIASILWLHDSLFLVADVEGKENLFVFLL